MKVENGAGSLWHEGRGRWSLALNGLLAINRGFIAVTAAGQPRSVSDDWELEGAEVHEERDRIGVLQCLDLAFLSDAPRLRIRWRGGAYAQAPVFVFSMSVENVGAEDVLLDSLHPMVAVGDAGATVMPAAGRAQEWVLLNQSKWMSDQEETWSGLDARQLAWAYHSTALCHAPSSLGAVIGIGETSNTVTRIGAGLRGRGFDLHVIGEMSVNRQGRPYRLKTGARFTMNRVILLGGQKVNPALEAYAEHVRQFMGLSLRHRPYAGIFCAYGQDPLDRPDFIAHPLTWQRVADLLDVLEQHVAAYGMDYIKTQFGGLSSGPGDTIGERRQWRRDPVFPAAATGKELAGIIREKGFTPDTFDMARHHPGGVKALSDLVHGRGFRHALVCRPFLNVESGPPAWDDMAAEIFRMAVAEWGYDYLMFDFISNDFENDHDDTRTMAEAIRDRFQRVRDAVGPGVFIEACMVMPGPVLGIADGLRPATDWRAGIEPLLARQCASRFYYHSRLFQLDLEFFNPSLTPFTWEGQGPDGGRKFFGSLDRVRSWVSFSGISGYSYLTGGVIEQVSAERWHLFSRALPVYGRPARPVDWPRARTPRIWSLAAETAGRPHVVIGVFNWQTEEQERIPIDLVECGLDPSARYVLFDFWAQKMLGIFSGICEASVSPGGCQVLFAHEAASTPVVIGTDRHVTGAIGLKQFQFDPAGSEMTGLSEGPPGSSIRHFIYVPSGQGPSEVEGGECEVSQPSVLRMEIRLPKGPGRDPVLQEWRIKLATGRVSI